MITHLVYPFCIISEGAKHIKLVKHRCLLWDKEVDCREKDSEIRSLKENIVNLIRQIEMHKAELSCLEKLKKLYMSKSFKKRSTNQDSSIIDDGEGHMYDLRPKGLQNSIAYNNSGDIDELLEDMDTSELEHSDLDEKDAEWLESEDFQDEWGRRRRQTAKQRNSKIVIENNNTDAETHKTSPNEGDTKNPIQRAPSVHAAEALLVKQ